MTANKADSRSIRYHSINPWELSKGMGDPVVLADLAKGKSLSKKDLYGEWNALLLFDPCLFDDYPLC
jgi:hypothetical protein